MVKLPVECILYGVPPTLQSASTRIRNWQKDIADVLRDRRGAGNSCLPHGVPIRVRVRYYYAGRVVDRDIDNILKPILDAAIGVIYQDDKQVVEACSHRFSRNDKNYITGNELTLRALQTWESDFIHLHFRAGTTR